MYLAYKYAKKKYQQRQQSRQASGRAGRYNADCLVTDDERVLTDYPDNGASREAPTAPATPDNTTTSQSGSDADADADPRQSPADLADKRRRRNYRIKIILGLFLPFTLQALDTTIVAPAVKSIADDFNALPHLSSILTAFTLPNTASLPLFAQFSSIFGRHAALQTALFLMTLGSALCTASPTSTFPLFLAGRALQGAGAAGINICVRTILADRVSLKEYAENWSVFAFVAGVGYGVGPVVGGYLAQVSWRWCFGVNLPVAVLGMGVVAVVLRGVLVGALPLPVRVPSATVGGMERWRVVDGSDGKRGTRMGRFGMRLATVDYGGQVLFLAGFGLLVLGFTWAGGTYAWDSAAVLATLAAGGMLTVAWLVYEWAMVPGRVMARVFPTQQAMMPWELLMQRDVGLLVAVNFATGAAMYAVVYFMDLYFTLVQGHSASKAGLTLLYFLPGLGAGVYMAMFFINVWPRQTVPVLLLGSISSSIGIAMLAWACHVNYTHLIYGTMALTGFGVGLNTNPSTLHGLAYFPGMTAPITCLASFAHPFGGTVVLTVMSTVFNNRSGMNHEDPRTGIVWAFVAAIPIMGMAIVATTFLGNVWIGEDGTHEVVHGAWFWSLLRGNRLQRVTMAVKEDTGAVDGQELKVLV